MYSLNNLRKLKRKYFYAQIFEAIQFVNTNEANIKENSIFFIIFIYLEFG